MDNKHQSNIPSISDRETIRTEFQAYKPAEPPSLWTLVKEQATTREGWWGDFDWKAMCVPSIFVKEKKRTPFWGLNSRLPLGLAIVMGFQHSLAMVSGVVTPILIMTGSGPTALNLTQADQQYLLSAALITSALLSLIQITRFKIWRTNYYLGTGLLSVVGPNFACIPATAAVIKEMYSSGYCPTQTLEDGSLQHLPCPHAWGAVLGTSMVCSFFEIGMSFLPPKTIKRLFPPIVSGTTILLIGCSVISTALQDWAGGSGGCLSRPATGFFSKCPNIDAPHALPWGSPEFLGLGFLVFATILLIENFGSPFMKSSQIVIGLIVGTIVAAATGYVDSSTVETAPAVTFVWVKTFPITVYGPAIIPFLIVFLDNMLESIGDITASCDVSGVEVDGPPFQRRIQGGLLADGVSSFIAACMTISPLVTFAQNNGVIALTRCANRIAGYCCCIFILLYGIFGKISAVFLAIPSPVLGGMNAFLFASVTVSGIRILAYLPWTRRDRFIVTASLALGMGTILVPNWFTHVFKYEGDNESLKGFLSAVTTIVNTGYCIGSLMAIFLNLTVPKEWGTETLQEEEEKQRRERDAIRDGFVESNIQNEEYPLEQLDGRPN
ncbi:permease family-domain-containing protein [Radiomyces spectabilis]|uniref:permease family-domain-containing protein n=1 Tax=Radiomyces spectabilis TaxID=64574 RepID=UPI00221FFC48|nr:permease family-domain-containing protein [Radiomyces spectabilis]KAI8379144.1 permease family-domain-containing protein [Radiomyces spectabilis]